MSQQDNNKAIKTLVEQIIRAVDSRLRPITARLNELEREVDALKNNK